MAEIKRVSPAEAKRLVDEDGYVYVDVRTVAEFEAEHPVGAFNVPLMIEGAPNGEFLTVMGKAFAKDSKLVLGCKTGNRSLRAANVLAQQGFSHVIDQRAGMEGARDPFGQVTDPGWKSAGLPIESGAGGDRSYAALKSR
jgi:rhodanese-related sulfurtransferase